VEAQQNLRSITKGKILKTHSVAFYTSAFHFAKLHSLEPEN